MKHLKIIGLVAVAVAAFMAFVGAGSASAKIACTENVDPCPKGKTIVELDWSIPSGTSASLKDTSNNEFATCTVSDAKGTIEGQSETVEPHGPITSLTWGKSGEGCNTTVDTVTKGSLELRNGSEVWAKSSEVTLVAFGISCTYGAAATGTKIGTLTTGAGATMTVNAVVNKTAGGFLCPSTARWSGGYVLTNHNALFLVNNAQD